MKIGIISMQRVPNYGSYLQAYGLRNILREKYHDVVFIDYKPEPPVTDYSKTMYALWRVKSLAPVCKTLDYFLYYVKKEKKFNLFYKIECLPKMEIGYGRTDRKRINVAVIGSDEVFNCTQAGFNVGFSSMLFGKNINCQKVLSYAGSFGNTTIPKIDQYGLRPFITDSFKKFRGISVRDENSEKIIKEIDPDLKVQRNLDPVLVADFPDVLMSRKINNYVLLYTYKSRSYSQDEIQEIKDFCRKNGKQLVSLGDSKEWADIKLMVEPLEVLSWFKHADFVITDTFHGTVMSIKCNTNFIVRIRDNNKEKMEALLSQLSQEDRKVSNYKDLQRMYEKKADFSKTNKIIELEKQRTREYLFKTIGEEVE
jgi:hypothetical protein